MYRFADCVFSLCVKIIFWGPLKPFLTAKVSRSTNYQINYSKSKEILPHCNSLICSFPVQSARKSKEIFPHCNALTNSVPVLCHF